MYVYLQTRLKIKEGKMKKIYMLVLVFMVLFSITMSVEALEQKKAFRQNDISAYADWSATTSDLTTYTNLSVTQSGNGTDIRMKICTYYNAGNWFCKSGDKLTQNNVFSMDKKFDFATLKSVQIEFNLYCNNLFCTKNLPDGIATKATVKATWTAVGKISMDSNSGLLSRMATSEGIINNRKIGTSNFGGMAKFKCHTPIADKIILSMDDNGRQIELTNGQTFNVTLESNPSTGYSWEVVELNNNILHQTGEAESQPNTTKKIMPGAPRMDTFQFEVINTGQTTLKIVYHRIWEKDVAPMKTFLVELFVR
jgi:inhibitor of cysteine peptidase